MLLFLTGLILGLLIGFCAGGWTRARYQVFKRVAARSTGKLTVQYRGPLDLSGTELSHDHVVVQRTEAR